MNGLKIAYMICLPAKQVTNNVLIFKILEYNMWLSPIEMFFRAIYVMYNIHFTVYHFSFLRVPCFLFPFWKNWRVGLAQSPWTPLRSDSNSQSWNIRQRMLKDEYIKEWMVWKSEKRVFWETSHLIKYPIYFFFYFQYRRKKYKTRDPWNGSN